MGMVKKELVKLKLPGRDLHQGRLFVDLCENIHIHFRDLRIVFSLDEYFEFAEIVAKSTDDVRNYLAQNPSYREGVYGDTIMVAGGKSQQLRSLNKSPKPHIPRYFAADFTIELQDESVIDEIHVHWRDYRISLPISHFNIIAGAFSEAKVELDLFSQKEGHQGSEHKHRNFDQSNLSDFYYGGVDVRLVNMDTIKVKHPDSVLDQQYIQLLHEKSEGVELPPIILSTEANGTHCIIDGHHRFAVLNRRGEKKIKAIITELTFAQSEPLRNAEAMLKRFDEETNYEYGTSAFLRKYLAERVGRYYSDHFHDVILGKKRRLRHIFWRKSKQVIKKKLQKYPRLLNLFRKLLAKFKSTAY